MPETKYALAIHGGAGTLVKGMMTPAKEQAYKKSLELALDQGKQILINGGTSLDAVTEAVCTLENSPLFNAGKGSVFTADETHEMDAAIMEGNTLNAGAVALVSGIKNPIRLARDVMENSNHVFLAGEGAMAFARHLNYAFEEPSYFYDKFRHEQWIEIKDTNRFQLDHSKKKDSKFGTVGAVARDHYGNLAAATSTGGMTNKRFGRVGDTPIIGSGNYANNRTCAVSCTGSGEYFIKGVVAYDVSCLMEYKGMSLQDAVSEVVYKRLPQIGGDGGLIAVDNRGNLCMPFNTEGMYRASITSDEAKKVAIYGI